MLIQRKMKIDYLLFFSTSWVLFRNYRKADQLHGLGRSISNKRNYYIEEFKDGCRHRHCCFPFMSIIHNMHTLWDYVTLFILGQTLFKKQQQIFINLLVLSNNSFDLICRKSNYKAYHLFIKSYSNLFWNSRRDSYIDCIWFKVYLKLIRITDSV